MRIIIILALLMVPGCATLKDATKGTGSQVKDCMVRCATDCAARVATEMVCKIVGEDKD